MADFDIDDRTLPPRTDALDDLLPLLPRLTHPPGSLTMLRLIAYDIASPKRWRHICETCEDYGVRVQYSLFECWLEDSAYHALWDKLQGLIDPKEDRLVGYSIDAAAVRKRDMAGDTMQCTEKAQWYVV